MLFIILENLFLFYFFENKITNITTNSLGLFASSLLAGILLLLKFHKVSAIEAPVVPARRIQTYVILFFFLAGLVFIGTQYHHIFMARGDAGQYSDIVPEIQEFCKRFLSGEYPYTTMTMLGYPLAPTYLPMQWMPFLPAQIMGFDPRWIAFFVWCIAAVVLFVRAQRAPQLWLRIAAPLLILFTNYLLYTNIDTVIFITVEIFVAGYYMLFITGMAQKNPYLNGFFITCCLLSRYSLVLWLPLAAFTLFISGERKQLMRIVATVFVLVLVLYVLPFMTRDWTIFYTGYKYYDKSALGEWNHLNEFGKPYHLFAGTGMAHFFYDHLTSMDVEHRLKIVQKVHLAVSLGTVFILGVWYKFNHKKISYKIFLLGSFKIYLAVFLAFIQVPYVYLMIVGNFVSVAIFCEQARYLLRPQNTEVV